MPHATRRLLAATAVGALALTACSGDEAGPADDVTASTPATSAPDTPTDAPSPDDTTATGAPTSPDDTTEPTPTGDAEGVPALSGPCRLEAEMPQIDHVTFAVPEGWQVADDNCEFFDPELAQLEQGTEPDAAVSVRVADVAFERAAEPGGETRDEVRFVGATGGYPMVRVRAEATGQGLRPEGQPVLTYLIDLDPGADDEGGTVVASARPTDGADFDLAARALDRMAETLRVMPTAVPADGPIVVTRVQGGGAPYTVTYDHECFRLRPGGPQDEPADEVCDVGAPDDGIAGAILDDGDTRVVAGLAEPLATTVVSDAASAPYGALTSALEGASAFAYEVTDVPVDVRARDVAGEVIARATIGAERDPAVSG